MSLNAHEQDYWVKRVLEKLNAYFNAGADFKRTQWIFDWSDELGEEQNIANYGSECRALVMLSTMGVIGIKSEKANTRERRLYQVNEHGLDLPFRLDKAGALGSKGAIWYRAYWVTDFNYQRYKELRKQYAAEGNFIKAQLSFVGINKPQVTTSNTSYRLKTMREGNALNMLSHCLLYHPNEIIKIDSVRAELKEKKISTPGLTSITQALRRTSFDKTNELSPFVVATPKSIMVRRTVNLTAEQLKAIVAAGTIVSVKN